MMAVIDTCFVLDALQNREPCGADAQSLFLLCANWEFDGFITAKSVTDIYYLTHRYTHSSIATLDVVAKLCTLFKLLDTTAMDIRNALSSDVSDFEDAVMIETAKRSGTDCIITRNTKDYINSSVPIYTPSAFIALIRNTN